MGCKKYREHKDIEEPQYKEDMDREARTSKRIAKEFHKATKISNIKL